MGGLTLAVPRGPEDLTSEWLEHILAGAGIAAAVEGYRWRRIGAHRGIGSRVVRIRLQLRPDDDRTPRSLVVKWPLELEPSRDEPNELRFYRDLAGRVPFRTPRCFYQARDPDRGGWILVLEDLDGLRELSDVAGVSVTDARTAVRCLAAFHASFWDRVASLDWVRDSRARIPLYEEWIEENLERGLAQAAGLVSPDRVDVAFRAARSFGSAVELLDRRPRTLVHLDFRADNMFVDATGRLCLLDFEPLSRLRGPVDLATFIGTSLSHRVRRQHGRRLLDLYLQELRRHGVRGYRPEDLVQDTRLGLVRWLAYTVALLPEPEVASGRLRRILERWIDRFTFAAQELDAFVALP